MTGMLMARPIIVTFPASDVAAICQAQTTAGAGNLIINGNLWDPNIGPGIVFNGYLRTISFTSTADLSALNFTVTGTKFPDMKMYSETIAGPNNNTVETTHSFYTVDSISVNGAVGTAVSVGSGSIGVTYPILYNYHSTPIGTSIEVIVSGTINYSFSVTNDDIVDDSPVHFFDPITAMTNATTDQLAFYNATTRYMLININSSAGGSLIATFIQQGIN
jgi:hypothetical protein